jgi:hypothetical protein
MKPPWIRFSNGELAGSIKQSGRILVRWEEYERAMIVREALA